MKYAKKLKIFFVFWVIVLLASFFNLTKSYYEKFNFTNSLSYEIQVLSALKEYKIDNYFDDISLQENVLNVLVKPSVWQGLGQKERGDIEKILNQECKKNNKKCLKVHIVNIK